MLRPKSSPFILCLFFPLVFAWVLRKFRMSPSFTHSLLEPLFVFVCVCVSVFFCFFTTRLTFPIKFSVPAVKFIGGVKPHGGLRLGSASFVCRGLSVEIPACKDKILSGSKCVTCYFVFPHMVLRFSAIGYEIVVMFWKKWFGRLLLRVRRLKLDDVPHFYLKMHCFIRPSCFEVGRFFLIYDWSRSRRNALRTVVKCSHIWDVGTIIHIF